MGRFDYLLPLDLPIMLWRSRHWHCRTLGLTALELFKIVTKTKEAGEQEDGEEKNCFSLILLKTLDTFQPLVIIRAFLIITSKTRKQVEIAGRNFLAVNLTFIWPNLKFHTKALGAKFSVG